MYYPPSIQQFRIIQYIFLSLYLFNNSSIITLHRNIFLVNLIHHFVCNKFFVPHNYISITAHQLNLSISQIIEVMQHFIQKALSRNVHINSSKLLSCTKFINLSSVDNRNHIFILIRVYNIEPLLIFIVWKFNIFIFLSAQSPAGRTVITKGIALTSIFRLDFYTVNISGRSKNRLHIIFFQFFSVMVQRY